jgi:hypothetical protein
VHIDYFVQKLRASVQEPETLVSISRGYCHLLSASLGGMFPENQRIAGLVAVLEDTLSALIADTEAGGTPDLHKMMTVLDAIEFNLDKFELQSD